MSLALALRRADLDTMIRREQGEVADLVSALSEIRESTRTLEVLRTAQDPARLQGVLNNLRVAASKLDSTIRAKNENIARWTGLLRQIQAG